MIRTCDLYPWSVRRRRERSGHKREAYSSVSAANGARLALSETGFELCLDALFRGHQPLARRYRPLQPPVAADAEGRLRRLLGAAARGRLLPVHVRRGVPEIPADTSLDTSIARRHAIAAASSQCLIRAGTSASARRAPARRTPARCAGGPSRTCSASSSPDLLITIIIVIVVGVQRLLYIYEVPP